MGMRISVGPFVDQLLFDWRDGFVAGKQMPSGISVTFNPCLAKYLSDLDDAPEGYTSKIENPNIRWCAALEHYCGDLEYRTSEKVRFERGMPYIEQIGRLEKHWRSHLKRINMGVFSDTLFSISEMAVNHRALGLADGDELGGLIIEVLSAGGLPCGCEGNWPDSPLVVYWPHGDQPTFK